MRSTLCLLALVALSFAAQASQGAEIFAVGYSTVDCTGATSYNVSMGQTGVCKTVGGSTTATYCSATGDKIYTYTFADVNCTTAQAYSVYELPTTCGWSSGKALQQCQGAAAGPFAPAALAFPPAGWATGSACSNATNPNAAYPAASTCTAAGNANIHCTNSASNSGFCMKYSVIAGVKSMTYGCSADGANSGAAYFSDDACTTLVQATIAPVQTCRNGASGTCGSKALPTLPTKGYTQYDNNNCVAGSNPAPTVLFVDGACVGSQTYGCSTINGTQYGSLTTFTSNTCAGTGVASISAPNVCNGKGQVFLCQVTPAGGAASTTAVSMIAMAFAALVAMVAARSL